MPDSIQSTGAGIATYYYDASQELGVDSADAADAASAEQASCRDELVSVAQAGVAVAGSVAALIAATPTAAGVLPGIAAFIGSSLKLAEAAADYADCRDAPRQITKP